MTGSGRETIFALATARGRAGIAVIRVSGPASDQAVETLAGSRPVARRASLRRLRDENGELVDEAIVLVFDESHSFTGERVAEFHVHGAPAVVGRILEILAKLPEFRPAEPGEFTRRALENGRLDLTQVEGLADLIEAETSAQLKQAQRVFSGELGRKTNEWRDRLVKAAALLEATIDFADEDVPLDVQPEVEEILSGLIVEWRREVEGHAAAERIRDGFEVAVVGPPNAGKSTLINQIARRDVAITSEIAGTTRDVIEVKLDLGGLAVTLLDTAGLRESEDALESVGIARSTTRAEAADLRVFLSATESELSRLKRDGDIVAHGKSDLGRGDVLNVSGRTGDGVDRLLSRILGELEPRTLGSGVAIRARHAAALRSACEHSEAALQGLAGDAGVELVAADLRRAVTELDVLIGRVDVEDILGHIFASFCIGK